MKGPVLLTGPPIEFQPWVVADVELIRNYLQDKYGLVGLVYHPTSRPAYGYVWIVLGRA